MAQTGQKQQYSNFRGEMSCAVGLLFLAFSFSSALFGTSFAFCPPGCECHDDSLGVTCNFSGLTAIPILLNPMLKSLRIRNSNGLKLDTFSIALYQDLESLELSDCQIAHLPAGIFSQLPMLRQLILHGNKLKRLDPEVFGRIDTLEMLDLSSNQLERIEPSTLGGLASLRSLNLSSNQLHILPANFLAGLHSLRILLLDRNRMSKVPDSQMLANGTGSSRLEELSLAGNILSELPSNAFVALPALTRLDLSANLISHIESNAFAGLEALLDLNLARNLLSISPQNAGQSWVDWPPTLERLDLSGNAWTQIRPGTFAGLRSLRELALEEMSQLTDIQADAFAELPGLERLSLANSAFLSAIDPRAFDWQQPEHLQHLDMSNCHLSTLDAKMLSDWATLKTLKLSGNRWICDCPLLAFLPQILRRQQEQGEEQLLGENVLCNEPEHLRDQKLVDFGTNANLPEQAECLAQSEDNSPGLPFLLLCSAAGLFMLASSLGLLLCCFWPNRQKEGRTDGCCWERCLGKEEAARKVCRDQSRTQLYATGSSFTESLIYEKGIGPTIANRPTDHFPSCDGTAGLANNFAATTAAAEAGRRRCENHRGHWRPAAAAVGCPKSMAKQQTSVPDWTDGEPDSHTYSCSSSSGGDDYYSSIVAEPQQDLDAVGKQCHRSPPDSPPPPPPPIFSDPPSWPPAALLAMANLPPCQLAAPPYQLRNQQQQMPQGTARCDLSRPPSMYAPQPPPPPSRWTPNY